MATKRPTKNTGIMIVPTYSAITVEVFRRAGAEAAEGSHS
jgi:hypothetical protein